MVRGNDKHDLIGVIRLNRPIYESIKRDPRATTQALLIVIFVALPLVTLLLAALKKRKPQVP